MPREDRASKPHQEYALSEGTGPKPAAEQRYIAAVCPVCDTRIYATLDQVGRELECPDCETRVVVPPPEDEEEMKPAPSPADFDEYPLCEEADAAALPHGSRAAEQTYIRVVCPVCDTLMKVRENQIGREIVCPDCRVPTVVRPPSETPTRKTQPGVIQPGENLEYAIRSEGTPPAADSPTAEQAYIAVECPLCGTRMHAAEDQVGQELVCPDCDTPVVVPPPAPKRKLDLRAEAVGEYGVVEPAEAPHDLPAELRPSRRARPGAMSLAEEIEPGRRVPVPPRWPFFSGIFSFPFYGSSWLRWVALSLSLTVVLYYAIWALTLGAAPAMGIYSAGHSILSMLFTGVVAVFGMMWTVSASVHGLRILQETAVGNDHVESWPEGLFVDWVGECFYVTNSLVLSLLPGLGFARLMGSTGESAWLAMAVSLVTLFPIVLFSMLEMGSALSPLSLLVCRSLFFAWRAWLLFYLETTVLIALVGWIAWQAWTLVPGLGVTLAATVLTGVLMIYFRLLGRLAYCCGKAIAQAEQPTDDSVAS